MLRLSYSQLDLYLRCPKQWYYRYIRRLPQSLTLALLVGDSVHRAIEKNFEQKIKSRIDLPIEVIQNAFTTHFDAQLYGIGIGEMQKASEARSIGLGVITEYQQHRAPIIQPLFVEFPFEISLPELDCIFQGKIDLIDENKVITDNKVSKRRYTQKRADESLQLTAYSYAYRKTQNEKESKLQFDVLLKSSNPTSQQIQTERTEEQIAEFLLLVRRVRESIKAGSFIPQPGSNCFLCSYRGVCKSEEAAGNAI